MTLIDEDIPIKEAINKFKIQTKLDKSDAWIRTQLVDTELNELIKINKKTGKYYCSKKILKM